MNQEELERDVQSVYSEKADCLRSQIKSLDYPELSGDDLEA